MNSVMAKTAAMTIGVVLIAGVLLSLVFRGPGDAGAIWLSAAIAVVVQLAAFALSRVAGAGNLMARMGTGMLLRFVTVVSYAFLIAFVVKIPLVAALVSLFAFFFISTLIEPLLIKS